MSNQDRADVVDAVTDAVLENEILQQRLDRPALLAAANLIRRNVARRLAQAALTLDAADD